jgi:hypothetical protein
MASGRVVEAKKPVKDEQAEKDGRKDRIDLKSPVFLTVPRK